MLFNKPSNTTTGFLLQTMLYVANITKNDVNIPHSRDEFLLTPMGADSGSNSFNLNYHLNHRCASTSYFLLLRSSWKKVHFQLTKYSENKTIQLQLRQVECGLHKLWRIIKSSNWIHSLKTEGERTRNCAMCVKMGRH